MRTPIVSRDQIPERFLEAFDAETANTGGQITSGPGTAMINSPEMRRRCNQISGFLRRESTLPVKLQELAMITTARAMDCRYIWNAHAAGARREGISDAVVDAIASLETTIGADLRSAPIGVHGPDSEPASPLPS